MLQLGTSQPLHKYEKDNEMGMQDVTSSVLAVVVSIGKVSHDEANSIGQAPLLASGPSRRTRQSTKKADLQVKNIHDSLSELAVLSTSITSAIKDLI